eukprot:6210586-Pleurochrysis_carterae.AAC.2
MDECQLRPYFNSLYRRAYSTIDICPTAAQWPHVYGYYAGDWQKLRAWPFDVRQQLFCSKFSKKFVLGYAHAGSFPYRMMGTRLAINRLGSYHRKSVGILLTEANPFIPDAHMVFGIIPRFLLGTICTPLSTYSPVSPPRQYLGAVETRGEIGARLFDASIVDGLSA